jgi:hypothetical protein
MYHMHKPMVHRLTRGADRSSTAVTGSAERWGPLCRRRRHQRIMRPSRERHQRGAYPRAGAVKQHALVGVAQLQEVADLGGGEPNQVSQRDHGALGRATAAPRPPAAAFEARRREAQSRGRPPASAARSPSARPPRTRLDQPPGGRPYRAHEVATSARRATSSILSSGSSCIAGKPLDLNRTSTPRVGRARSLTHHRRR